MKKFTRILLILAYATSGIYAHTLFGAHDAGVYHIAPDNKNIEYRYASAQTYTDVEQEHDHYAFGGEHQGYPAFKFGTTKTRQVQKVRHHPAGLYYKDSDVRYDVPVGTNIVYSLVKSPTGDVQRLVVWRIMQSKMTQNRINRDCVEVNDTWVAKTALLGLLSGLTTGLFGRYVLSADDKYTAACALAGLIGGGVIGGYSNSGEKRWVDCQYMTNESRNILLQKMIAAGDKRASWVQNTSLSVVDVLEVRTGQRRGKAHIDHFAIKPATPDDVAKAQENNHGEQGSIAYALDGRVMQYAMTNDEHGLTLMARLKRVVGLNP